MTAAVTGWHGRMLKVDLTSGRIRSEAIPMQLLQMYLGGRGLGVRLLRESCLFEPFAAEMPIVFAVGPLCGTATPTSSRLSVVSRSPLTGTLFDSSCGGLFARRLKGAGYDVLLISGASPEPVVLTIDAQQVRLEPASRLWGLTVSATIAALADDRFSAAVIGPAGENRVLFANIITSEGNAAGRGGLGAVMGGKGLKGIRVCGDLAGSVAEPERLAVAVKDMMRLIKASPVLFGSLGLSVFGTATFVDLLERRRMVPTRNFSATGFGGSRSYNAAAMRRHFSPVPRGCDNCPIACKKATVDGRLLPGHGSLSHFGALLGIADPIAIVANARLCDDLGLDTVSAAATLACYGELRGYFPGAQEVAELLRLTARRQDIGDQLAQGSQRLAESHGSPHLSMTVKGLELPAYDPRGAYGMALGFGTSNRGGCHLRAYSIGHEVLRKPVATHRLDFTGKARITMMTENANAAVDSLVLCRFTGLAVGLEEYAEILAAVTGLDYNAGLLGEIGERIWLNEHSCNRRNGFAMKDDLLPQRFYTEVGTTDAGETVAPLDQERYVEELGRYYRLRGLDEVGNHLLAEVPEGPP